MSNKEQNAFPHHSMSDGEMMVDANASGLTKLEYFAAAAMQGMLANSKGCKTEESQSLNPYSIAERAVNQAKELMERLKWA